MTTFFNYRKRNPARSHHGGKGALVPAIAIGVVGATMGYAVDQALGKGVLYQYPEKRWAE